MKQTVTLYWLQIGGSAVVTATAVNAWFYLSPVDITPLEAVAGHVGQLSAPGTNLSPIQRDLTEVHARPLFSPTRRDFAPLKAVEIPAEQERPVVDLARNPVGPPTITLHGTRNILSRPAALISLAEEMGTEWYEVGQSIGGWTLNEIRADGISLNSSNVMHEVRLYPSADIADGP